MELVRTSSRTIFLALLAALALALATFVAVAGMPGLAERDAGNSWHKSKIAGNSWHKGGSARILAGNSWH
jgi:hypothetical protein